MCTILEKLCEITPNLPHVPLGDFKTIDNFNTSYVFEYGTATSQNVYSTPDIAIAKTFIPEGTAFEPHVHTSVSEWIIVLSGKLKVFTEEFTDTLVKYDSLKIPANKPHSALALEDTIIIAITVPKDEGYPEYPKYPT